MNRTKVVTIGGGTGLYTLLRGLKNYDLDLSAIVNMTDDGGSTGELRDEFGILPPGDIRRCIVALSESPEKMKQLFQYRFTKGSLKGHSFGNLFITALREIHGSDEQAIDEAANLLKVKGQVIPVTLDNRKLIAVLENNQIIAGQTNIDLPKHDGKLRIKKLLLDQAAKANPRAIRAIKQADFIILGPGDLYGSVIANLIIDGISYTLQTAKAKIIYICNLMTKYGETNGFSVNDFAGEIEKYLGSSLDYLVYNSGHLTKNAKALYRQQRSYPVKLNHRQSINPKTKLIKAPLASRSDIMRHDSAKLAQLIWTISQLNNKITFVDIFNNFNERTSTYHYRTNR